MMDRSSPIHVATTCNDAYFPGLCVTVLSSLVANTSNRSIKFHIFDTGLSASNKTLLNQAATEIDATTILSFIAVSDDQFKGLNADYGGGFSTYIRILMGTLIKESRVLYIDSDFLVLSNLSDHYDRNLSGKIALASKDVDTADEAPNPLSFDCPFVEPIEIERFYYYNCGVLLVDLDAWRSANIEKCCFELIGNYKGHLKAWDQTILNYILRGRWGDLDPSLCWSSSIGRIPVPGNIHYISRKKPWTGWSPTPSFKLWYEFHRIFLNDKIPLKISLKEKFRGFFQYYRDMILAISPCLARTFIKHLKKRKSPQAVYLYDASLERIRKKTMHPSWKCEDIIRDLQKDWEGRSRKAKSMTIE